MKPKGSLQHSQVPATCPYPEPARSSSCPHFLKIYLNIILPSTRQVFVWEDTVHIYNRNVRSRGPGSVVGIATAYGLDGPEIESRWGRVFPHLLKTGPEAHPASCTMGTGSFPGVRCGRGVTLTPSPPSSAEVKNRVELYLYSP
jgi:hypothetical protein